MKINKIYIFTEVYRHLFSLYIVKTVSSTVANQVTNTQQSHTFGLKSSITAIFPYMPTSLTGLRPSAVTT